MRSASVRSSILAAFVATAMACHPAIGSEPSAVNVVPLIVRTPHAGFNRMVVSVTVCEPGADRCATIDDVLVDTGSTGLRLEASAIPRSLRLPAMIGPEGLPLAECLRFVHDTAWGPLRRADIRLGGIGAGNLAIQVIADDGRPQPAGCPVSGTRPTSNGTLGVGPWLVDCPGECEQDPGHPGLFVDRGGTWFPVTGSVARAYRLRNPVSTFPEHGNGVVFDLPMPPRGGSDRVVGTLTFGVGTSPENRLDGARLIGLDGRGRFTTLYGGRPYPDSYVDSGTETNLVPDDALPRCSGMPWAFCAIPDRMLAATMLGRDGTAAEVGFRVGDYRGALDRHVGAWDGFAEAGEPPYRAFVWGAPFFLGRRIYIIFDGQVIPGMGGFAGPAYGVR